MTISRSDVACLARAWIGTPYHNRASVKGAGCDCIGLVRGLWREITGTEAPDLPVYSPRWLGTDRGADLLDAAHMHLVARPIGDRLTGTVLLFRLRPDQAARHCGVMVSPTTMVHAHSGRRVYEVALAGIWQSRITGVFDFPGVID